MRIDNKTIVALATPEGEGGIAVIRISGENSIEIVEKSFSGKIQLSNSKSWHAQLGKFFIYSDENKPDRRFYDQVIVTIFRAPNSYTMEDVVEISCHGGRYVTTKIIETIIKNGARLAQPGEFTFRAFINGRIDLTQAEAVADLIHSNNDVSIKNSISQLEGTFSNEINVLKEELTTTLSLLELELDFSEEDVQFANREQIHKLLQKIEKELQILIESYQRNKLIRDGLRIVLVGKPNVGKSSLMNFLLKENRAIVSDIPGTTRDTIEEQILIQGIPFRVIDSAGLIDTENPIEREGINRTHIAINESEIILYLIDGSKQVSSDECALIDELKKLNDSKSIFILINKCDILNSQNISLSLIKQMKVNFISAKTGEGISTVEEVLVQNAKKKFVVRKGIPNFINIRQKDALEKAYNEILFAQRTLVDGFSGEYVASILRNAMDFLSVIIGEITTDEILNNIFTKFCIGK